MRRKNTLVIIGIAILAGLALWAIVSPQLRVGGFERGREDAPLGMTLGLDLQGGVHLVFQAESEEAEEVGGVMDIIEGRINALGVTEPTVQQMGRNRILIELPGVTDVEEAVSLIGQTAKLDFREVELNGEGLPALDEEGNLKWVPALAHTPDGQPVALTGEYLKRNAFPAFDPQTNEPSVAFEFDSEGAKLFEEITGRLLGRQLFTPQRWERRLGIFLDDRFVSAPEVISVISAQGRITGVGIDEARRLAILLNEGALPTALEGPIVRYAVNPTLGADFLNKGVVAGGIGLGFVLLFMILYYRLPGVLAGAALLLYALLVITIFKMIPVTLTLAGIAAFILSIGMAVDANILIFERLREELRRGRSLGAAIEAGFARAWPSIRDSNVSTFITCGILFLFGNWLGEPGIKGFALTLAIGVTVSMFSAILVTRTFLRAFVGTRFSRRLPLFLERGSAATEKGV